MAKARENRVLSFDEWVRIVSGLSNKTIATAISVDGRSFSESQVQGWRRGLRIPDPYVTLLPLQIALKGPWPPATAEKAWRELHEVIEAGLKLPEVEVLEDTQPDWQPPPPAKKADNTPKPDPELDALKLELEEAMDQLTPAVAASEQLSMGWFSRTIDKQKKYFPKRDARHRKAYLLYCVARAEVLLEKSRAKRADLITGTARLGTAIKKFEAFKLDCSDKMSRKIDENLGRWREIQKAGPIISMAQQAFDKATNKNLTALDESIKRTVTLIGDWKAKSDAIAEEGAVNLSWLTRQSHLGERLVHRWKTLAHSQSWPADVDPFEGQCVCKDKLADGYKLGEAFEGKNPVEIDLPAEIDLTVVGLEGRQKRAQEICAS